MCFPFRGLPRPKWAAALFGLGRLPTCMQRVFLDRWFCYHMTQGCAAFAELMRLPWARLLGPFGAGETGNALNSQLPGSP